MNSLISIIVPCYNQAHFLDECLQSVFDQTYHNWECIIVNDGSLDITQDIAQKWVKKENRFKYIYKDNGGLSSARNLGLNLATGDYIQFLDSDDFLCSTKIESSLRKCTESNNDKSKIVISNFRMFTDDVNLSIEPYCKLKEEYFSFQELLFDWDDKFSIPIHCGFFEATIFKDIKFPEDLKAKEDWIIWLIIFQKNIKCYFLDMPLVLYRTHPNSMTKDKQLMENNYFKAVFFLKTIIPQTIYIDYLEDVLNQNNQKIIILKKHINNYKKSNGYKILELLKKNCFIIFFAKRFK